MNNKNILNFTKINNLSIESGVFRIKKIEHISKQSLDALNIVIEENKISLLEIYKLTSVDNKIIYVLGKPNQFMDFLKKYDVGYFNDLALFERVTGVHGYIKTDTPYGGLYFELLEGLYFQIKFCKLKDDTTLFALIENISLIFGQVEEFSGKIISYEFINKQNDDDNQEEFVLFTIKPDKYIKDHQNFEFINIFESNKIIYYLIYIKKIFVPQNYKFILDTKMIIRFSEYSTQPLRCSTRIGRISDTEIIKVSKNNDYIQIKVLKKEAGKDEYYLLSIPSKDFMFTFMINKDLVIDIFPYLDEVIFKTNKSVSFEMDYKQLKQVTLENTITYKAKIEKIY